MTTLTADSTLTLTRRFKAPRERVFAAFTTAEAIRQWFGCHPPNIVEVSSDFRVGGSYRFSTYNPETSKSSIAVGVYREITPPSKIVYTWKWENEESWVDCESLVTFEFTAVGEETELHLTQVGFPSDESASQHTQGWNNCLGKLDSVLTGAPAPDCKPCA